MQMTIDDLKKIVIPDEFGCDDDDYGDVLDEVINQIPCNYAYGVSKFVIFINDKEVAKIPFNGQFFWDDESKEYVFENFHNIMDYCALEADIYEEAVTRGLEMFFAGTRYVGHTADNTPFYISERVNKNLDDVWDDVSDEEVATARTYAQTKEDFSWRRLSDRWLALALRFYGKELVDKFVKFIKDFGINDLHFNNVGVREDGSPCLIDYSGWQHEFGF